MGSKPSKPAPSLRDRVEEEIARRMMIQREVQMSINILKARDTIQIFGSTYATFVGGVCIAHLAGRNLPPVVGVPIAIGGLVLGNIFDMAYGNKLARVTKEAEHIMEYEISRLMPRGRHQWRDFIRMKKKEACLILLLLLVLCGRVYCLVVLLSLLLEQRKGVMINCSSLVQANTLLSALVKEQMKKEKLSLLHVQQS
jgi:hypothetical protein